MEYLSYVFSIISIVFYSIVYFPQFREIYITKNTDGISIFMLLLWTQADFMSLIGTILMNLNLSVVLMGWYHSFIGLIMIMFVWFYKYKKDKQKRREIIVPDNIASEKNAYFIWYELFYICIFFMINIFISAFITIKNIESVQVGEILGWITMSLYIFGRFPQIYMNFKRQKTEGLSYLMYIFTMCGNTSYIISLVAFSIEMEYIRLNLPWIISCTVTAILDIFVIWQIFYYKKNNKVVMECDLQLDPV